MKETDFTIIVPVYNEKDGIENTLQELEQIRKDADFEVEVLVVNDGSDDGSKEVLGEISCEGVSVMEK